MDAKTEEDLLRLLDRERILDLMNRYFSTIDEIDGLDVDWACSVLSSDIRVEHRGFTLEGFEDLVVGNRFVREGWDRTFHLATNAQIDLDEDTAKVRAST